MSMSDCPCCLPPWSFVKPIPDPYSFMKINATTGEIIYIGSHGNAVTDIDSDGTYFYICGGSSATGLFRVRKGLTSNGSFIWSVQSSISMQSCTLGVNGLVVGGSGTTGTIVPIGTGTGTGSSANVLGGKDLQMLDYGTGEVMWNAYLNPDGVTPGLVRGIAVDSSGNVYAVGAIAAISPATATRACISKYDATGHMLWSRTTPQISTSDNYTGVATDGLFVTVSNSSGNTPTVKHFLCSDGSLVWTIPQSVVNTDGKDAAMLSDGSIAITGAAISGRWYLVSPSGTGPGTGSAASGMLIQNVSGWFTPALPVSGNGICVDSSDNVYMVTSSPSTLAANNFNIFKFSKVAGVEQLIWRQDYFLRHPPIGGASPLKCCVVAGFLYVCGAYVIL